jgi:hypothetical protein
MSNTMQGGAISLHCPGEPGYTTTEPTWKHCTYPSTTVLPSSTTMTYATSTVKATTTTASAPSSTTGVPTTLSSSPTTIACAIPEGTPGRIVFEDGSCKVQPADVPYCQEDEPCWDCHTMGNHVCGTTTTSYPLTTSIEPTQPWQTSTTHVSGTLPHTGSPTPAEAGVGAAFFGVGAVMLLAVGLSKVRSRWNS